MVATSQPHDVPQRFIKLIEALKKCNKVQLETLVDTIAQDLRNRTFFLDALPYVGTEPALQLITTIVTRNSTDSPFVLRKLSPSRIWDLSLSLSFLPVTTTHPCLVLKYALNIAKEKPNSMTPTLVLGGVINKALEMPDYWCVNNVKQAIDFLTEKVQTNLDNLPLNFDPINETFRTNLPQPGLVQMWENVIHAIKALGNAGTPQTIHLLSELVNDRRLQTEGRAAAVYALKYASRRTPFMVRSITKTLFLNPREEQEIRVAAFVTYIYTLTYDVPEELYDLLKAVTWEQNQYLKSFVCTYLLGISRTEAPSFSTQSRAITYYLKRTGLYLTCPVQDDRGYFSSKATRLYVSLADAWNLPRSLPRDVMGVGLSFGVLSNDASWVPRTVHGKLMTNLFGYDIDLLEIGLRGTGIERLIQHIFGPAGYLRKGTRNISPCELDRSRGSKDCEFEVDLAEENITGSVFLKFLNQEIGWKHIEQGNIMRKLYTNSDLTSLRETITDVIFGQFEWYDVVDIVHRLSEYWKFFWDGTYRVLHDKKDMTKTVHLLDIKRVIPTVLGMPLNLTVKAAGHVHLDSEVEISYVREPIATVWSWSSSRGLQPQPDKLEGWGKISPKFSVWSEVNLSLDGIKWQPRLVALGNATSNFTQQVNITLTNQWHLTVKVLEMPENETKLLNASYVQFAEVRDVVIPLGIKKRDKTMLYDPVGADLLKLTLWSNINYPNSTGVAQAPFFPLSGAASLSLDLQRHENLEMIEFNLYNETDISLDEGHFDISVTPVGTSAGIKGYSSWWFDSEAVPPRKGVKVELNSLPVNFSSIFYGNTTKRMDIKGIINLVTEVSNTSIDLAFDRTHFHGVMNRIRHTPEPWNLECPLFEKPIFTVPEFSLEVDGSLADNSEGYTSVMLHLEGSNQPQWLKASYTARKLMVNVSAQSSLFDHTNLFFILPYPIKSPICHVFDSSLDRSLDKTHIITFDDLRLEHVLNQEREYVLARHRHLNDTFAVTKKGKEVMVYINDTIYTLTPRVGVNGEHIVKVNNANEVLPYKEKHVIYVRQVERNGSEYIRLSAWAGVDIYYSDGDIQLAVNGFYINQTAGLCGNANYNSDLEDELHLPVINKSPLSVQEFTRSWSQHCTEPSEVAPKPPCEPNETDYEICDVILREQLAEAHFHVAVYNFYNACISDVQSCLSPLPSIRAYIRAAHAKEISVSRSGCYYGNWSWSPCMGGKQYWKRRLIYNLFSEVCSEIKEVYWCKNKGSCWQKDEKRYLEVSSGGKYCRSAYQYPVCPPKCNQSTEMRAVQFQCIQSTDSLGKLENMSPTTHAAYVVTSCWRP
jgi:hypothetical protein